MSIKKFYNLFRRGLKKVWETIKMPEMQVLPGQLAFFFLLSLIPMIALITYLGIHFSVSIDQMIEFVESTFPTNVAEMLMPIITGKTISGNMYLFLITSFILASNGANSIILVSNNIYKIETPHFLKRRIKAIIMTFFIVLLLIFMFLVPTFGNMLFKYLAEIEIFGNAGEQIKAIFNIVKLPISFVFIFLNIRLIYTMAPDKAVKSRNVSLGALFTTVGWILASNVYSIYISNFNRYDIIYGSISNLIVLFLWIYLIAYIFVLGLAMNVKPDEEER